MPSIRDWSGVFTDEWVLRHRPPKNRVDPERPYAFLIEPEFIAPGRVEKVATVFLTNRECPFRCLMCDLWKNTTDDPVPVGAIPRQIRWALGQLPPARHVKLYNSGNFFDPHAIPEGDYHEISEIVAPLQTVVVESHPRMIGRRCFAFHELIGGRLEVAMGLETANPQVLAKLNKRMTLADFARAAKTLTQRKIRVRAFILLRPPFLSEEEGVVWAQRSVDFAFDAGVECCVVIPTRGGNGAMQILAGRGQYAPPAAESLEEAVAYGIAQRRGRVFADLWDMEKVARTAADRARIERLRRMNLIQQPDEPRAQRERHRNPVSSARIESPQSLTQ